MRGVLCLPAAKKQQHLPANAARYSLSRSRFRLATQRSSPTKVSWGRALRNQSKTVARETTTATKTGN